MVDEGAVCTFLSFVLIISKWLVLIFDGLLLTEVYYSANFLCNRLRNSLKKII